MKLRALAMRRKIINSLSEQGFIIRDGLIIPPPQTDKDQLRQLHKNAVFHKIESSRAHLERHEPHLITCIAQPPEVDPLKIRPRLVEIQPDSEEELLFRYVRLHWSVPVSAGYGRRLRYAIYDEANGKLMGVFGLSDPVYNLRPRDHWIGWDQASKKSRLKCVMDIFVLGAVPPYSYLLCGKLVALLATSKEVQHAFSRKYRHRRSEIRNCDLDPRLVLLTTSSALGRSSIYNRLTFFGTPSFISVGFTQGSGDFHFANGFYSDLRRIAEDGAVPTAKDPRWGNGFRNRREVLQKALPLIGLDPSLLYHGVRREVFVAPLARNAIPFLQGRHSRLYRHNYSVEEAYEWFRARWLIPRVERDQSYKAFDRDTYLLWRRGSS